MARVVVPGLPHHVTQRGVRLDERFIGRLEKHLGRSLRKGRPGPPKGRPLVRNR